MTWEPSQYLKFAGERLRPAIDLLTHVPLEAPATVLDLGCGAGNVTRLLRERWPSADVAGVDSSPEMLARAREALPDVPWVEADVATWTPPAPADLIYSNAALHWLDDHATLFPRLLGLLRPGGVLAVQMPRNHGAPSHQGMLEAARSGPWAARLQPHLRPAPVAEPAFYHDVLRPGAAALDIWETEYLHALKGDDPVVSWTQGTGLKPLLDALDEPHRSAFLDDYRARMRSAYPRRGDGYTLFPFRRLFLIARAA